MELAQVARGALGAQMLDRAIDHPVELVEHLLARGRALVVAEQLGEQPRVAERSAGEHDRRRAGVLEHPADVVGVVHAARDDHRDGERGDELGGEVVVGHALVLHGGRARVEADARDAGLLDEPPRHVDALGLAALAAGAQLDRDREAGALARGDRDRHGRVGVAEHRGARAGLADLGHGAAHVEVDDVRAGARDGRRRRAHDRRGRGRRAGRRPARPRARAGGSAAARCRSSGCRSGRRSSTPSPTPRARRRSAWPAGARTSSRSRPAARARPGWGSSGRRGSRGRGASAPPGV